MPADDELDPLDRWLNQQVRPLPPPSGTFDLIAKRARRRKVRKVVLSVASAAVVAAAVGVAVPLGMSLHLNTSTNAGLASGQSPTQGGGTESALGTGSKAPSPSASSSAAAVPGTTGTATPVTKQPGPVPANFAPTSVTFVNTSTGWVIGQAGTPGSCANKDPYICTSIARTDDAGKTWQGGPAPDAGAPSGATGVSGIRFLDGVNGWAFGPALWVTHDAGQTWQQESTDGTRVTDLETVNGRAYALFAACSDPANSKVPAADWAFGCTSYTLMTTTSNSDEWTRVSDATTGLTDSGVAGASTTSGSIALSGTTGYLVAPDGTLYSGPIGGAWTKAGTMPCQPGTTDYTTGQASSANLAIISSTRLATFCAGGGPPTTPSTVYTSDDGGATWTASTAQRPAGDINSAAAGDSIAATSISATSDGTIVLATFQGIEILPPGATTWQAATINGSTAAKVNGQTENGGFLYVGMTSATQGVAISDDSANREIWLTFDGGRTWTPSAIKLPGHAGVGRRRCRVLGYRTDPCVTAFPP
jgi:hypothetical protein